MRSLRRGPQRLTALVDRETLQTSAPWVGGGVLRAAALADDVRHHLELAAVASFFSRQLSTLSVRCERTGRWGADFERGTESHHEVRRRGTLAG